MKMKWISVKEQQPELDVPPEFQKNEDGWLHEPELSIKIDCLEDNHVWWWRD